MFTFEHDVMCVVFKTTEEKNNFPRGRVSESEQAFSLTPCYATSLFVLLSTG
jgi:hypothetical protein